MAEIQKNPPTSQYEQDIDQALAIAGQAGPPPDDFITRAAETSRHSIGADTRPIKSAEDTPRPDRRNNTAKKVGTTLLAAATLAGGVKLADMFLDAADHQAQHVQEVNDEMIKQQQELDQQLQDGVIYIDPASSEKDK